MRKIFAIFLLAVFLVGCTPTDIQVTAIYQLVTQIPDILTALPHIGTPQVINVFYFENDPTMTLGFTLTDSEKIINPLFIDMANRNFNLQAGSPAMGMGAY